MGGSPLHAFATFVCVANAATNSAIIALHSQGFVFRVLARTAFKTDLCMILSS